jgi:class 3 adenylate cyclase
MRLIKKSPPYWLQNLITRYWLVPIFCLFSTVFAQAQNSYIEQLKAQVNESKKDYQQVKVLNDLAQELIGFKADEAKKYAEKAQKLANQLNYQAGLAEAYTTLGHLEVFKYDRPDRGSEYHEKAYRIYKQLHETGIIDKLIVFDFLNDYALPAYKFAVEADSKRRKYRKAIQNYGKLNTEFTDYLTSLASETKEELKETENKLSDTENKLSNTKDKLEETQVSERKLAIEKIKISGNLEKKELEALALADSLYDKELELKEKALKLLGEKAQRATAEREKAEFAQKAAEYDRQRLFIILISVALLMSLLLGLVVLRSWFRAKKVNRVLREQRNALTQKNEEINQQNEEILTQRDNIEQQNMALQQQKEEILSQRDNIEQQNIILQQQKEEIMAQRDFLSEMNSEISEERDKSDNLLLNIMPAEIAQELKQTGKVAPRYFEMATVMFTDFKGFTRIAEKLTPEQIVQELNRCFQAFDEIIEKYDLEKIKTMGDGYLCAGGIPIANKTNPIDVIKAGLAMIDFMNDLKKQKEANNEPIWEVRVGIHTGPLVAGVIGKNKFAFDIWGDTVNVASRLEASGEPGKVNISGDTYELVKSYFKCSYRGKIFAKNKGEIDMYFVESKASFLQGFQNIAG